MFTPARSAMALVAKPSHPTLVKCESKGESASAVFAEAKIESQSRKPVERGVAAEFVGSR